MERIFITTWRNFECTPKHTQQEHFVNLNFSSDAKSSKFPHNPVSSHRVRWIVDYLAPGLWWSCKWNVTQNNRPSVERFRNCRRGEHNFLVALVGGSGACVLSGRMVMLCPKSTSINIINSKLHLTVGPLFLSLLMCPVYCSLFSPARVFSSHLACELCCSFGRRRN